MTAAWLWPLLRQWGVAAVFAGVFLESAGLPLPGETVLLAGGFLAQRGLLPLPLVIVAALAAALLGDHLGYLVGRRRPGVLPGLARWVGLSPGGLERLQAQFRSQGARPVLVARFVTGLRSFAALLAGATGLPWPRFAVNDVVGAALWASLVGALGYGFGGVWSALGETVTTLGLFALAFVLAATMVVLLARHGRRLLPARGWHPAPRELILAVANLAAVAVFVTIAEQVLGQESSGFDQRFELAVHGLASPALGFVMDRFTDIGSAYCVIPALLVLIVVAWRRGDRRAALALAGVAVANEAVNMLLKDEFQRIRPSLWAGAKHLDSYSFPSGHSMSAVACWGMMGVVVMRLWPRTGLAMRIAIPLLALGIGLSRIYLGVHWPTDVMGGFTAGAFMLAGGIYALGRPLPHADGSPRAEPAPSPARTAAVDSR